jgi:two-component system osmolarity sensor histidine kinase EnvZ
MQPWRPIRWFRRVLTPRILKRFVPTSLFGRSLLIILLPILVMQGAVTWAFFEAHWRTVTGQLSEALAGDIGWDVSAYEADPTPRTVAELADRAEKNQSLSIVLLPGRSLPTTSRRSLFPAFDAALRNAVDDHLAEPFFIDSTRYPAYIDIRVKVKGGVLRIIAPRDRAFAARGHIFILWLTVATLALTGVAILFIRNQVRAIERLAEAAEAFGKGDDQRFKPHGAREVRQAGQAFLNMKSRIQRHIDQRTVLLASVSHDLRTPLTRLKLEAALAPPSPRIDSIKSDLAEMEHMIDEYLAFARGQGGEALETIAVRPLIEAVSQPAAAAGATVTITADPDLTANVRPNTLKRALSNLVMNAAAHGRRVSIEADRTQDGELVIRVGDDGPGIPPERYEEAFKPFSRLDESRNQNVKGVGLGLAIARDVARGHGGDVTLDKSPLKGLQAIMRLPA